MLQHSCGARLAIYLAYVALVNLMLLDLSFDLPDEFGRTDAEKVRKIDQGGQIDVLHSLLDLPNVCLRPIQGLRDIPLGELKVFPLLTKERSQDRVFWPSGSSDCSSHVFEEPLDSCEE